MLRRNLLRASLGALSVKALALPDENLYKRDPENWWSQVRKEQYLLSDNRIYLNTGSLGLTPRPVLETVQNYLEDAAKFEMEYWPRWGYETLDEFRQELADFYGCKKDELAITHNATEAMSTIGAGVELKAGDEVLLTDQEHPSGRGCWYMRQARQGIQVREVKLPIPPKSPGQLADIITSAISPRTRVLSFSGITTVTGLVLPVRQICDFARSKGVITVVDGAHMHGQIPFKISDLNCDYMAGSPHKWAYAPAGCGLLYIREENLEKLWPSIVTGSWEDRKLKAARFMGFGTNNRAIIEGMMAGLKFLKALGPERVYARIHEQARYLRYKAGGMSQIELLTPEDDRMYGGLVTIRFKHANLDALHRLLNKRRVWCFQAQQVRLATHIHTRKRDIDLYFDTVKETV